RQWSWSSLGARSAVRRSAERAASGPLDLHDLLFLGCPEAVDLANPPIGRALELVELSTSLVGTHRAVTLLLLEVVGGVAAEVADLDAGLLHPLVDASDEVPATLFGERRDVQPDDRPVDVRHEAE